MKSKLISISAISSAFVAILLTFGAYIEFFDLIAVVLASIFVLLPIYFHSYKTCFLTYFIGGIIAFLLSGFNLLSLVFPMYFLFFGIYPIIKCIAFDKKFNKLFFYILSAIWCIIAVYGAYFYYANFMGVENIFAELPLWVEEYIYVIIGFIGILFFFVFDKFIFMSRILINTYLSRILK